MKSAREENQGKDYATELALSEAYQAVFAGNATKDEADIVLIDLALQSGFFQVDGPGVSADQRAYSSGQRSVYAVIHGHLSKGPREMQELHSAVRQEAILVARQSTGYSSVVPQESEF